MKKKDKNLFILFLIIILFVFSNIINFKNIYFSNFYIVLGETKDWFYEIFSMQTQDESEKKIDIKIKNGFFPSGIDFDGLNLTILFTKLFPYKIKEILEWKIESTEPNKKNIIELLKKNIENGFFPINISYSDFLFMVLFIKFKDQPAINSFNIGIYPYDINKKEESFKIISKNINDYIKRGYIINGFSSDKQNFYLLFTKTHSDLKIKNWAIDWVLMQNYSFNNYMLDIKTKNRKIIDIKPDDEFLILLWIEE
ncbi:MAG: hypothetical protein N3A58_00250 [Spirochaetes bacterium]|nr:hypothetical protein [Spirochaetota bacterium]